MEMLNKIFAVILSVLLCFGLAACGAKEDAKNAESGNTSGSAVTSGAAFNYSKDLNEDGTWKGVKTKNCIELCDYSNIFVSANDVLEQMNNYLSQYPDEEHVFDRAVKDGDKVNIDYVGSIDGVEFEGGNTGGNGTNVTIGVTQYIDDFLEQLIGHEPGDKFDVNVTFPDDYGKDELNGKDAVFKTTINYISENKTAELTDEFVEKNLSSSYGWKTVEDMRMGIANNIATNYIHDNSNIKEVPDVMVEYQLDEEIAYYENYASAYGMSIDDFIKTYVQADSVEAFREDQRSGAEDTASFYLMYQALAEDMKIEVSEKDIDAYFEDHDMSTDVETMKNTMGLPYLKTQVMIEKVNEELKNHIVFK